MSRVGDARARHGASFYGLVGVSLMPIVVGVIALFVVLLIAVVVFIVCRRRSTSSKAAVVSGVPSGTAVSSALLAGQRTSCGSSVVMATPHQMDKRLHPHHQYAELRAGDRPAGVVSLTRPSPSPPAPHQPPIHLGSPFSSYSSISKTAVPVTVLSQHPYHHHQQLQHAYQMQQQLPHLQYSERC